MNTVTEAAGPRLRVLPIPVNEPHALRPVRPVRHEVPETQGTLALSFSTERTHEVESDPVFGPQPPSSRDLPEPRAASVRPRLLRSQLYCGWLSMITIRSAGWFSEPRLTPFRSGAELTLLSCPLG